MKQIFFFGLIFFFLSCGSGHIGSADRQVPSADTYPLQTDTMNLLKRVFHGDWYQPEYIVDVAKTLSPLKSQDILGSIVEINIDTTEIKGDSLEVGAPSIHEGNSFMLFFNSFKGFSVPTSLSDYENKQSRYELTYKISSSDTILILSELSDGIVISQREFRKAPSRKESAIQYMVNKTLFAGRYKGVDSSGQNLQVEFNANGSLTGVSGFRTFYVLTDFVAGPLNNLDEVCFDIQTDNQRCFAFKISGDTIRLFSTKENEDHVTLSLSELKYEFVRLK